MKVILSLIAPLIRLAVPILTRKPKKLPQLPKLEMEEAWGSDHGHAVPILWRSAAMTEYLSDEALRRSFFNP